MTVEQFANTAQSTLSAQIGTTDSSLSVENASAFPSQGQFRVRIGNELIIVGAVSGTTFSGLTRGAEGTTAAVHGAGAAVTHVLTADALTTYVTASLAAKHGFGVNVADYGAVGDARDGRSITTTSGSAVIHDTTETPWFAGDVGKYIAGPGVPAATTILSYQSSSQITLSANCTATQTLGGGDGITGAHCVWYTQDDSTAITAAQATIGTPGGRLMFPGCGYVAAGLTLPSRQVWQGCGLGATYLFMNPTSSVDLVATAAFSTLTGTGNLRGPYSFGIREMTLDGGSDWAASAGWCLRQYGSNVQHSRIELKNGRLGGLYSEYGVSDDGGTNTLGGPQGVIDGMICHGNLGPGVQWHGPHDTTMFNFHSFLNGGQGLLTEKGANYNAGGLQITGCHFWSNCGVTGGVGVQLDADTTVIVNAQFELGASQGQALRLTGNGIKIQACEWLIGGTGHPTNATMIVIGTSSIKPSGCTIVGGRVSGTSTTASPSSTALDMTNTGDFNVVRDLLLNANAQTSGVPYVTGARSARDDLRFMYVVNGEIFRYDNGVTTDLGVF